MIFSKTYADHVQHVGKVLQRMIDHKLEANLKKCVIHTDRVEFLGYEITPLGVNMCQDRVKSVMDWAVPHDLKSLQSFLGFCNFYRSFIKDYSLIAAPLTDMTKKGRAWNWTTVEQTAFERMKEQFGTAEVVRHFDPALPIVLETDASDFALSGILSQQHSDGLRPVSFYSRKFQPAELNYDTHDKELLPLLSV